MPPWPPGGHRPRYVGQELRTLDAGAARHAAPLGARAARPARRPRADAGGHAPALRHGARPGEARLDARDARRRTSPGRANGATDDYRCFLLDPAHPGLVRHLGADRAGVASLVHHVILYRVPPERRSRPRSSTGRTRRRAGRASAAPASASRDERRPGRVPRQRRLDLRLGARLRRRPPAGRDRVELPAGSRIVMQVHYNLLNGSGPDRSRAVLTTVPATTAPDAGRRRRSCRRRSSSPCARARPARCATAARRSSTRSTSSARRRR